MVGKLVTREPLRTPLRRVPFAVTVNDATSVAITGDFTQWSEKGYRLTPGPNHEWSIQLNLTPGEYQYRLRVNDEWRDHPEAARKVPNPFGTQNCVLIVP